MKNILLTTDLSEASQRAFAPTVKLARALGMGIVLLHVVHELAALPHGAMFAPPVAPVGTGPVVADALVELERLSSGLGVDVKTEVIVATEIPKAIAEYAEEIDAEYIALSTHGRSGVQRLVMGSVAEGVLRQAKTPMICFPLEEE